MSNYWVIPPFEAKDPAQFDRVWQYDRANGLISIGWYELGGPAPLDRAVLQAMVSEKYSDAPPATQSLFVNMVWSFYHDIAIGDLVIARRGRKAYVGVGEVVGPAAYEPARNAAAPLHSHSLPVRWLDSYPPKQFESLVFPMHTVWRLPADLVPSVLGEATSAEDPAVPVVATAAATEFVLEKYLEDFLVSNFDAVFKGELAIYDEQDELEGQQFETGVGKIDILAIDKKSNDFVVIELKKGQSSDQVVGQVLRYMGWVKANLCTSGRSVRGLVVCQKADQKLKYALSMTPGVALQLYKVDFHLTPDS